MAMTLADVRAKYPQYKDVADDQLADALYKKFYPTADRREFDARIGLKPYDSLGTGIVKGAQNAIPSLVQSAGGAEQALGEAITGTISPDQTPAEKPSLLKQGMDVLANSTNAALNPLGTVLAPLQQAGASALASMLPQDTQKAIATEGAKESLRGQLHAQAAEKDLQTVDAPPLSPAGIASTVTTSTIQMLPALAASIALKNPTPALAMAYGQSGGQAYAQGRQDNLGLKETWAPQTWGDTFINEAGKAGLPPEQARQYANLYGVAEAIPEALPLGVLLKEGGALIPRVGKAMVTEGVSEGITQAAQSALDKGYVKPDMTWGEAWPQIVQAMAAGAISGGIFGAVAHGEHKALGHDGTPTAPEPDVGTADTVSVDMPVEQRLGLPGPGRVLALPSPDAFAPNAALQQRRAGPAPTPAQESLPPSSEQVDYQARVALQRTRQQETADLLKTAREAVTPLGTFTKDEIGGPAAQRVNQLRIQTGRPLETPVTIDELARAKVPQQTIDAVISARRPMTTGQALTPLDITTAAKAKNIIANDGNFAELAQRTTGQRNIERMTQAQLNALKTTIDSLPAHPAPVTVPIADQSPYTDEMYGKALDAVRNQGRYTASAIKDATGLKRTEDVQAIRDAMVRRGQLVKRGEGDYRLFDIVGQERQAVPDDLPPGAFTEHVVRRIPVNKIQIKKNGKSLGTFGSASEARGKIRDIRAAELGKEERAQIELAPAADVAYGVMQNRYDEQGNLLGQVVVDTHRSEDEANRAAAELNTPDTGARYTQTSVTPTAGSTPLSPPRQIEPAALAGRVPEIVKRLNKIAADRKLPMLGVRVLIKPRITTPEGQDIEGLYFQKLIELTTQNLDASMTTDQLVDRLAQVMDHESIHALRAAGVLAPETSAWKTLSRYTKRAKRGQTGETYFEWANHAYAGVPGYETMDSREEEAIAEAFRAWATNRRAIAGAPGTAFRQIVEWFKRLLASVPDDLFKSIETGRMVADALTPPGSNLPRAKATEAMTTASEGLKAADAAQDENAARVMSRDFLRAQAQAREDRYGRSGPKTVLGTNPTTAYDSAPIADRAQVAKIVDKYKSEHGVQASRLMTLLPEDLGYLSRIADAQQKALHDPKAVDVAKAYSALIDETRAMFKALGPLDIVPQTKAGSPYASAKEMMDDIATGRLVMRTSTDMFGEGADNPGHPMYEKSGYSTTEGTPLVYNDLLRIVHDVYGHGQSGFRDDPRGQYNSYHEHARLLSPLAARALATETLAQNAWQNYGPHLRRRDGTVPRETDVDYLPPMQKEFALQKAFVLPEELIAADPGWAIAAKADGVESPRYMVGWHGTPHKVDKFSKDKIGTGEGAQAFGYGLYFAGRKEVAEHYRNALTPKQLVAQFREALPDDADFTDVMELVGTGHFTAQQDRVLKALEADDWLGFDYPSQAISAAYSKNLDNWDPSQELRDAVSASGNLYKVDLPEDNELLDWDKPLSEQPAAVKEKLPALAKVLAGEDRPDVINIWQKRLRGEPVMGFGQMTGEELYKNLRSALLSRTGEMYGRSQTDGERRASEILHDLGIPGHRFLDGQSRTAGEGHHNYVIYDDSRIQILEENPKYSKFDEDLPGGRLYGNPNKSPGGQLSKPGTPTPAFTSDRPGNRFFGGEMAEHQLQMARTGERGATIVYLHPEEFVALAGAAANPEQAVYDDAVAAGYKLSTMPSLVIDGYAGIVRAVDGDGHAGAAALVSAGEPIPVVLYPKKGQSLGLVTALEGNGVRVAWPHEGRAENFPQDRIDGEPRYSLNAPYGTRVPDDGPADAFNIVQQRTDTRIGAFLNSLGRSKRHIPGIGSVFDMRKALDDKWLSWKELMEDTRRDHGIVNDINDVYMLAQLYDGKVFEQISQREEDLHKPLLAALKLAHDGPLKIQPKEFEDYLYARHAPERNAYLRTRGSPIDNPSGMSDAEANATLNKFALDGKLPEMESLARLADKITLDTTRTRVEAGLITAEAAASQTYRYYVPLKGFADEELDPGNPSENQTRARTGKGFSVGGREDRTVKGRSRKAGDILGHLFLQNTEAVIRAGKNEVVLAGAHFLKDNGTTFGTGRILTVAPSRLVVGANGMIHEAGDPSYRQRPDIVIAKWKGQEIVMQFEDPALARALKSDYTSTSDGLLNALNTIGALMNRYLPINKVLATVNTALSPVFILTNPLKDAQTAAILGAQYDIKNFSMKMMAGAPKAIVGIREVMRKGTAEGEWAQLFKQMQAAGGTTEFMGIHDLETQIANIRRSVSQTGLAVTARQAGQYLGHVTKFISDYNKVAENALRLSAFKVALDAGVSEPRAAYLAKNLTVNFNKGGEAKVFANAAYLFYNASTQGSMGILRGLKNKRVQRLVGGVVVAGLLQDLINRMISGDSDDNGVTDYDDVPDYVLQTNLVLMDPLHLTGPRGYFSFPMPYGFNAFYNLGRNMGKGLGGQMLTDVQGKKTVVPGTLMDAGVDSLLGFVNAFNPLGGVQSIANFISPTITDPLVDLWNNADYTGAKIVPDRFDVGGVPVPDSQKYWSNTGEVPKAIAEQLNHLTGGNDVRKGLIDVSPEVLQYGFDYVTGALGKLVQRAAVTGSAVPDMLRGDFSTVDVGNIPFAQRFVGSVGSRGNTERYYNVAKEVATVQQEIKMFADKGDRDGVLSVVSRSPIEVQLGPMFDEGEKALGDMRKKIRDIRDNPAIPEAKRTELVKKLKDAQDLLMARLNRAYFAAKAAKSSPQG